jgi:hypothetical protein
MAILIFPPLLSGRRRIRKINKTKNMNENKLKNILIGTAIILSVFSIVIVAQYDFKTQNVGNINSGYFSGGVTNSSTTAATGTASLVLTKNPLRQYAAICNDDPTYQVFLQFIDATSATTTSSLKKGYQLNAGYCYEIMYPKLFIGSVYAMTSSTQVTAIITTLEK